MKQRYFLQFILGILLSSFSLFLAIVRIYSTRLLVYRKLRRVQKVYQNKILLFGI